jgi:prophage regulatory protein
MRIKKIPTKTPQAAVDDADPAFFTRGLPLKNKTLINRKKLLAMIPLSERTIFNMEQRGEFPRRIALTSRNVAWDLTEVEEWIEARKSSGNHATRPGFTPSVAVA